MLVVEDEPNAQKLTEINISGKYDVCLAVSVEDAKQQLKEHSVELVLLDLSLKGEEDGLDLVHWMRKTKKWAKTPVIATTAHAFITDRDNCLAAGCDEYLSKPIKKGNLLEMIGKYFS